jgi:hypothetical protein
MSVFVLLADLWNIRRAGLHDESKSGLDKELGNDTVGIYPVWIWQVVIPASSPIASINTLSLS